LEALGGQLPHRFPQDPQRVVKSQSSSGRRIPECSHATLAVQSNIKMTGLPERSRHLLDEEKTPAIVELKNGPSLLEDARLLLRSGADGIQFDKIQPEKLTDLIARLHFENPKMIFFVAGGIDEDNIGRYAATGADTIVTSAVYHALPSDIGTKITPL
jgi:nicotinate-nucleotide pyrophosphorylase